MRFILTGAGAYKREKFDRATWEMWAVEAGHIISPTIGDHSDTLVSSRMDTVKARDALARGCSVITYDEFYEHLARGSKQPTAPPPPPVKSIDTDALQDNPLWGSF